MSRNVKRLLGVTLVSGSLFIGSYTLLQDQHAKKTLLHVERVSENQNKRPKSVLPSRSQMLSALKSQDFDVLIIGGGATGSGCALDSVSRGLKTALVELDDFSSGTSSRSTKLIHGGVRYLQQAISHFDFDQYLLVQEALFERDNLLRVAPHLSFPLPIMIPIYKYWQIPYYWSGIKLYDLLSGGKCLKSSYFLSKERALESFPMLKNTELKGAIVYYDGSHNDSRMNLSIAITAAREGAILANHVRVTGLIKSPEGKITGVSLIDELNGEVFSTRSKCVINATGPFTDSIRVMDNAEAKNIVCPSSGVHIVLPDYYSPTNMGLLDPSTSDGRVIFFLPWMGSTIAGTTDSPCTVSHSPSPREEDIQFILKEVRNYLTSDIEVRRGDVLSAWSGIRPLVLDPNKENTQSLVRNHVIHISSSGLVTIAGGKWTTYRSMAEDTLNQAVEAFNLPVLRDSQTKGLLLEGAHTWTPNSFIHLVQDLGVDSEVAKHLSNTYGDRAFSVGKLASLTGIRWPIVGIRIHPEYPYIEAEIRYAIKEYACTAVDVIARRLRLSFLNVQAAEEALPRVIEIMSQELGWSSEESETQMKQALLFLKTEMGKDVNKKSRESIIHHHLSEDLIVEYTKKFNNLDTDKKGYVSINDIRRSFKKHGLKITGEELHAILSEIDTNKNGQVELAEYLQLISAIQTGVISNSRFAQVVDLEATTDKYGETIERSGGGL